VPLTFAGRGLSIRLEPRDRCEGRCDDDVKVAHVRPCHSRMMFVRAYPRETQEMVQTDSTISGRQTCFCTVLWS
jgi:hypothetical protein